LNRHQIFPPVAGAFVDVPESFGKTVSITIPTNLPWVWMSRCPRLNCNNQQSEIHSTPVAARILVLLAQVIQ